MRRHPDEIKQQCQRETCTRERYELIQSPIKGDKRFVCKNCWNYLYETHKEKMKIGDSEVTISTGTEDKIIDIQYEHNRYQLKGISNWQYGIENISKFIL